MKDEGNGNESNNLDNNDEGNGDESNNLDNLDEEEANRIEISNESKIHEFMH